MNAVINELIAAIETVPRLPGAACRDNVELYDHTIPGSAPRREVLQARRDALQICRTCPALKQCNAWVDSLLPWYRPRAVVAGRLKAWAEPRPEGMALTRTRWASGIIG